jgi:basic amino acid/polyamine antiporter, APA family
MSLVITGVASYDTLNHAAPVAQAFSHIGLKWNGFFLMQIDTSKNK